MLVLSRKLGEQIRIGMGIEITVLKIHGGRVQIGVQAPREVPVRRDNCHIPVPDGVVCSAGRG